MRLVDIAAHAADYLPQFTDYFTDTSLISSVTVAPDGQSATVETTTPHNLNVGNTVTFSGTAQRTPISNVSVVGGQVTFTTSINHDLTLGWPPQENITIGGFTNSALNGSFRLVGVPNRRNFVIETTETISLNGNEYLLEIDRVDSLYKAFEIVTVPTPTSFVVNGDFQVANYEPSQGKIQGGTRVYAVTDLARSIEEYAKENTGEFALFIAGHPIEASKDRSTFSDAIAERSKGSDQRQKVVDGFDLLIVAPTSNELLGAQAADICRHDLLEPLSRTFNGQSFGTGLSDNDQSYRTVFLSSGIETYVGAYLVYRYSYQQSFDLTYNDSFRSDNAAFRDTFVSVRTGQQQATANANLDVEPLP